MESAQYTAVSFTEALLEAGIAPSVGTVGDALDNALMESTIGLYKTELVDHDRARAGAAPPSSNERPPAGFTGTTPAGSTTRSPRCHPSSSKNSTNTPRSPPTTRRLPKPSLQQTQGGSGPAARVGGVRVRCRLSRGIDTSATGHRVQAVARVVVTSCMYLGDTAPFVPVARRLHEACHDVTFVAPEGFRSVRGPEPFDHAPYALDCSPVALDSDPVHTRLMRHSFLNASRLATLWMDRAFADDPVAATASLRNNLEGAEVVVTHPTMASVTLPVARSLGAAVVVGHLFPMMIPTTSWAPPLGSRRATPGSAAEPGGVAGGPRGHPVAAPGPGDQQAAAVVWPRAIAWQRRVGLDGGRCHGHLGVPPLFRLGSTGLAGGDVGRVLGLARPRPTT